MTVRLGSKVMPGCAVVFAVFALWMWVKMVRDDYRRHQPVPAEGAGESADVGVLP